MRSFFAISFFLIPLLAGCGKKEPVQAYGKPVAHWLEELRKPNAKARKKAVLALGQIGTADPETIPALIAAVKDTDAMVKETAILALLHIGPPAKDAVPALIQTQSDPDPAIRAKAKKALDRIQEMAKER
jgi:HEAT repeat protein